MIALIWGFILKKLKSLAASKLSKALEPHVKKLFNSIVNWGVTLIGKVEWEQKHEISYHSKNVIHNLLVNDYYIIATRRGNHLSTFFIGMAHFFLTGRWGFYSHVLMNLEDEVKDPSDFRLIEATGKGVNYNTFAEVFKGIDAVAVLKPRGMTIEEWTKTMDKANEQLGKPYDTLFDLKNDQQLSCVELIRTALMSLPDYSTRFAHFEKMINKRKNLTPQMFLECDDFEIVLAVKG
jgi:hypothetical protein